MGTFLKIKTFPYSWRSRSSNALLVPFD